jgi:hypothetical protein
MSHEDISLVCVDAACDRTHTPLRIYPSWHPDMRKRIHLSNSLFVAKHRPALSLQAVFAPFAELSLIPLIVILLHRCSGMRAWSRLQYEVKSRTCASIL